MFPTLLSSSIHLSNQTKLVLQSVVAIENSFFAYIFLHGKFCSYMQFIAKFRKHGYSKHSFKIELNAKRGLTSSLIIHACDNVLKFYRFKMNQMILEHRQFVIIFSQV